MATGLLGPRLIIAGTSSGVGKTTLATAIMSELSNMGLKVAPAKVGPDFIDPSYHELACGNKSHTLDTFLMGTKAIREALCRASYGTDIAVIEGVMGLFDGTLMLRLDEQKVPNPRITRGSTAEVAALTKTPIVLIVDATATSSSLAAAVDGFSNYSKDIHIAGVVINNYGSKSHLELITTAMRQLPVEIIGAIPRGAVSSWRSRHLGLIPVIEERESLEESISNLRHSISGCLDMAKIIDIARSAPSEVVKYADRVSKPKVAEIAVARGKAFSFTYPENLEALELAGANIAFFDPMTDTELPKGVQGLYVGGGFPEIFAKELSLNVDLNHEIKEAILNGLPTWAECGGLMWLSESVDDSKMVGAIPAKIQMSKSLTMGYVRARAGTNNCLSNKDEVLYGHEFHYSNAFPTGDSISFETRTGSKTEGFATESLFASYLHIHLGSQQHLADKFVSKCSW